MTRVGPAREIACPSCGAAASVRTLLSTSGARLWSDGHLAFPMLTTSDPLARCPACQGFFWRDELPGDDRPIEGPGSSAPPLPEQLEPGELRLALEQRAFRNADDERTLRLLLWWRTSPRLSPLALADVGCVLGPVLAAITTTLALGSAEWTTWVIPAVLVAMGLLALGSALAEQRARRRASSARPDPDLTRELEALIPLLRDDPPEERLMRADALRQLGRTDEALTLVREPQPTPAHERWAQAIRRAAKEGDRLPREV